MDQRQPRGEIRRPTSTRLNAWDVASAIAFADAGFPAVGTTSFGVAAMAGLPDGGRSSAAPNRELARRLAALDVLVSMDFEDGYDDDPELVARCIQELGVACVNNIEVSTHDRLVDPSAYADRLRPSRSMRRRCS